MNKLILACALLVTSMASAMAHPRDISLWQGDREVRIGLITKRATLFSEKGCQYRIFHGNYLNHARKGQWQGSGSGRTVRTDRYACATTADLIITKLNKQEGRYFDPPLSARAPAPRHVPASTVEHGSKNRFILEEWRLVREGKHKEAAQKRVARLIVTCNHPYGTYDHRKPAIRKYARGGGKYATLNQAQVDYVRRHCQ